MKKVLVVDDQRDICWLLSKVFEEEEYGVAIAHDGQEALNAIRVNEPDAVIMDLKMPRLDGMSALDKIKFEYPHIPVIIITAYGDIPTAVKAMKLGASDFIAKPFNNEELLSVTKRAIAKRDTGKRIKDLESMINDKSSIKEFFGTSPHIQKVISQIQKVAPTNFTVILQGETGSGKELIARIIHRYSLRSDRPFIALDCGAIPETLIESELFGYERGAFTGADRGKEGQFELASGGTLFLDEISNLPFTAQGKLLRVLQERKVKKLGAKKTVEVDVRIIVAANVTLKERVKAGSFREDLYHRLNEFILTIPPLRERKEDILFLAKLFLDEANMELEKNIKGLSEEAKNEFLNYSWPGNGRELRNVIRRAVLLSNDVIEPEHISLGSRDLGTHIHSGRNLIANRIDEKEDLSLKEICRKSQSEVEKEIIQQTLQVTKGNKRKAARILKIDYKTLYYKMKAYGLSYMVFIP